MHWHGLRRPWTSLHCFYASRLYLRVLPTPALSLGQAFPNCPVQPWRGSHSSDVALHPSLPLDLGHFECSILLTMNLAKSRIGNHYRSTSLV